MELEVTHTSKNQCSRYINPSIFDCFELAAILKVYKKALTLLIDLYGESNVTIILKIYSNKNGYA